jgi:hypothetical protein
MLYILAGYIQLLLEWFVLTKQNIIQYTVGYATTNECYNEQFLSINSGFYNEHSCYNERMLQRTDATTNSFYQ